MENVLKEQYANLTLILCEFERDFVHELGDLSEIYDMFNSYVNWSRDILANYCFENFTYLTEILDEEISMLKDLNYDCHAYNQTNYISYINSMISIVKNTFDEVFKILKCI